jgi:hypothetical protein
MNEKFAFVDVDLQICISQTLQHFLDVLYVLLFEVIIDENMIYVSRHKIVQIIEQHIVHLMLICDQFIAKFEW